MVNITSVSIPYPILERARKLGINVSGTARKAVVAAVLKEERKARAGSPNTSPELPPLKEANNS